MAKAKHPSKVLNDELAAHVFHPKVLKHAREYVEKINTESAKNPHKSKKEELTLIWGRIDLVSTI
jgi:hypothetical protein